MKSKIIILNLILSTLFCLSCKSGEEKQKNDDWFTRDNLQKVTNTVMFNLDSESTIYVESFANSDSLVINIENISRLSDSEENSQLIRDYLVAKIFIQNDKFVPEKLNVNLSFVRGLDYSFSGDFICIEKDKLEDSDFVDYLEFLILNVRAEETAYFDLTIPVITEYYRDYDFDGSLLSLLVDFYFFKDELKYQTWFLVFYENSDFPFDNLVFNRSVLDSVLVLNGFEPEEWTREKINDHYLNTYGGDTIWTIENEVYYVRE